MPIVYLIVLGSHCKINHFSLPKCRKIRDFNVDFFNFLGACSQTPILGRGYGAPPQTPRHRRSGASRLDRYLRSLHRASTNPQYFTTMIIPPPAVPGSATAHDPYIWGVKRLLLHVEDAKTRGHVRMVSVNMWKGQGHMLLQLEETCFHIQPTSINVNWS